MRSPRAEYPSAQSVHDVREWAKIKTKSYVEVTATLRRRDGNITGKAVGDWTPDMFDWRA